MPLKRVRKTETLLNGAKKKADYRRRISEPNGFEEMFIDIALGVDEVREEVAEVKDDVAEVRDMVVKNTLEDQEHRDKPAHKAHKWTWETYLYVAAGLAAFIGGTGVVVGQIAIP